MTQTITLTCASIIISRITDERVANTVWLHSKSFIDDCIALDFKSDEYPAASDVFLRAQRSIMDKKDFTITDLDLCRSYLENKLILKTRSDSDERAN